MILIDGQFEDRPAVRHKEILWAMAQGIVFIGAGSMGALRAAELDAFGMIGVGLIYRWYRRFGRGPLSSPAPDDAVAVHSGPPELGFLPLTDALVDLQRTFSAWSRLGAVSPSERDRLTTLARDMNFQGALAFCGLAGRGLGSREKQRTAAADDRAEEARRDPGTTASANPSGAA